MQSRAGLRYEIRAQVFDITEEGNQPRLDDQFLVDSNVWVWMTYLDAKANEHQIKSYPPYIEEAIAIGATLHRCELSLSELAHQIEKGLLDTFCNLNSNQDRLEGQRLREIVSHSRRLKTYRHNYPDERATVVDAIKSSWRQVMEMSSALNTNLCEAMTKRALEGFSQRSVDAYDLFMVQDSIEKRIDQVVTDDGDFATVGGIKVFTANKTVIREAERCGKLMPTRVSNR